MRDLLRPVRRDRSPLTAPRAQRGPAGSDHVLEAPPPPPPPPTPPPHPPLPPPPPPPPPIARREEKVDSIVVGTGHRPASSAWACVSSDRPRREHSVVCVPHKRRAERRDANLKTADGADRTVDVREPRGVLRVRAHRDHGEVSHVHRQDDDEID